MEELFIRALNVSIAASFLVLAVIIYRVLARRSPKWISVLLWGLVGLRLLLPFELESPWSLVPSKSTVPTTITQDRYPALDTGFNRVDEIVNPILSGSVEARPEYSASPMQVLISVLGWVWLGVALGMLVYMAASFIYLRVKTRVRVEREEGIYLCDFVRTPFILGVIKPKIFLPSDVSEGYYPLVVAHERAHIKRLDHVWKPLGFLLLSLYWFNPILWIAYVLFCRDVEMACDERVISTLEDGERADYSLALLSLGVRGRVISAYPPAFGEVSVKSRVSAIAGYKKPATVAVILSLAVCVMLAGCFLTYKKREDVAINAGVWYAWRVIGSTDATASCDGVPMLVFTEGGDLLVESRSLADLSYVRLGRMNSAYVSRGEYGELFEGVTFREGYGAEYFYRAVKAAWRITPSATLDMQCDEVYLLRSEDGLYMGYADGGRIGTLYELRFNESTPTYLYTLKYVAPDAMNAALYLDSSSRTGRIMLGDGPSYEALGSYEYEGSRLIFTTSDDFALRLVFLDVGGALVYSERESELNGLWLSGYLPDGVSFGRYYRIYSNAGDTCFFDVDGDGRQELVHVGIGEGGSIWYLVARGGETVASATVPFTDYDDVSLEERDGALYLVCGYRAVDLGSYRYKVSLEGDGLVFLREE